MTVPGASPSCSDWRSRLAAGACAAVLARRATALTVVSTFLSALVARAGQKNVLFVVIVFPLLAPAPASGDRGDGRRGGRRSPRDARCGCSSPTTARPPARRTCSRRPPGRSDAETGLGRLREVKVLKLLLLPYMARDRGRGVSVAGAGAGIPRRVVADRLLSRAVRLDGGARVPRRGGLLPRLPDPREPAGTTTWRRRPCRLGLLFAVLALVTGSLFAKHHVGLLLELGPARVLLPAAHLPLRARTSSCAPPSTTPTGARGSRAAYALFAAVLMPFLVFVAPRVTAVAPSPDGHQPPGEDPHGHADAGRLLRRAWPASPAACSCWIRSIGSRGSAGCARGGSGRRP